MDKYYKCHHGNHKVLTILKAMNCSLNGMSIPYSFHVDFKNTNSVFRFNWSFEEPFPTTSPAFPLHETAD